MFEIGKQLLSRANGRQSERVMTNEWLVAAWFYLSISKIVYDFKNVLLGVGIPKLLN